MIEPGDRPCAIAEDDDRDRERDRDPEPVGRSGALVVDVGSVLVAGFADVVAGFDGLPRRARYLRRDRGIVVDGRARRAKFTLGVRSRRAPRERLLDALRARGAVHAGHDEIAALGHAG